MSTDFLQSMAASSAERVRSAKQKCSSEQMLLRAYQQPVSPLPNRTVRFDLIAEVKLRSPAVGHLKPATENIGARVTGYAAAGAAAVSVLTEPERFDGELSHLASASRELRAMNVPAMRKDFLVDPYQVIEARAHGASGVLVILRMLPRSQIEALVAQAMRLDLFVLLEAFDEREIELAHAVIETFGYKTGAWAGRPNVELMVGVNCRDLTTLEVVPGRLEQLAHLLPTEVPRVAESGVNSAESARSVAAAGYDFALVGSALMKAPDPFALVREMLAAGRAARSVPEPPVAASA
jgi:indole-3-glycerol phosphate synthase